jgi:predicted ATP-grasp superfamily ATP-dependent carboligase
VAYRNDYKADPEAAKQLVSVGETAPSTKISAEELAAWTMVASTLLNLDETISK